MHCPMIRKYEKMRALVFFFAAWFVFLSRYKIFRRKLKMLCICRAKTMRVVAFYVPNLEKTMQTDRHTHTAWHSFWRVLLTFVHLSSGNDFFFDKLKFHGTSCAEWAYEKCVIFFPPLSDYIKIDQVGFIFDGFSFILNVQWFDSETLNPQSVQLLLAD